MGAVPKICSLTSKTCHDRLRIAAELNQTLMAAFSRIAAASAPRRFFLSPRFYPQNSNRANLLENIILTKL
jgi:RsiW-degrading membrane proteinase PrsW (M82 family)